MKFTEPDSLAKVGALARHLEVKELFSVPLSGNIGRFEFIVFIVSVDEIFYYGARFPNSEVVVVRVGDCWNTAVGIDFDVPILFGVLNYNLDEISPSAKKKKEKKKETNF